MLGDVSKNLIGIVLGVRFRANFSVQDKLGRISDDILYSRGSPFGPTVFPKAVSTGTQQLLYNEDTGSSIRFDNSNFILEATVGPADPVSESVTLTEDFERHIIKGVMKDHGIKEINRVGYVRRYVLPVPELAAKFIANTVGSGLSGVNDINLQFSMRSPIEDALLDAGVNDYHNAIITVIKHSDKKELFMSVDFQRYFDPFLPSASELELEPFTKAAEAFTQGRFVPWVTHSYLEAQ